MLEADVRFRRFREESSEGSDEVVGVEFWGWWSKSSIVKEIEVLGEFDRYTIYLGSHIKWMSSRSGGVN